MKLNNKIPKKRYKQAKQLSKILVFSLIITSLFAGIALAADKPSCDQGPPVPAETNETEKIEIALIADTSTSMETGSRFSDMKNALSNFSDNMADSDEGSLTRIAEASLEQTLTPDNTKLKNEINNLDIGSNQHIPNAMDVSQEDLVNSTNATDEATKAMILITDGEPVTANSDGINKAQEIKNEGTIIFTIGLGNEVNETYLQEIASGDNYYYAPDSSDLNQIYDEIQTEIETISKGLIIETRNLFKPGDTHSYTVYEQIVSSNEWKDKKDVTNEVNLVSSNTSILTVNNQDNTITATGNNNISTWATVSATYNGSAGCRNVIVSKPKVKHLELLPGAWQYNAIIMDNVIYALIFILFAGIMATRFSTAFGGLAIMQLGVLLAWFGGWLPLSLAMVSVFLGLFIGFNLVANIDYSMPSR